MKNSSLEKILLGVNIDHSATLRQARYRGHDKSCGGMVEPDPVALALLAERAGADGITVHLREDRRHIRDRDVLRLREAMGTRMNLEMACTPEMTRFARETLPHSVCLVPEGREEITTEGGLDLKTRGEAVQEVIHALSGLPIEVSLFIDPDPESIDLAAAYGAPVVELHTGAFANRFQQPEQEHEWERLREAAEYAHRRGLTVNAGHGINYVNIAWVRTLPHLHELNIGHSILARSLFTGIEEAVREMHHRIREG